MTTRAVDPWRRLPRVRGVVSRGVVPPRRRRAPVPRRPGPRACGRSAPTSSRRHAPTTRSPTSCTPPARRPARHPRPRAAARAGWSRATRTRRPRSARTARGRWCSRSASRRGSSGSSWPSGPTRGRGPTGVPGPRRRRPPPGSALGTARNTADPRLLRTPRARMEQWSTLRDRRRRRDDGTARVRRRSTGGAIGTRDRQRRPRRARRRSCASAGPRSSGGSCSSPRSSSRSLIKTFLFQAFYIPSESMVPTLEVGDRVLVNKLSYDLHDVNRGDIVVFEAEPNPGWRNTGINDLVKRVIALPGETVARAVTHPTSRQGLHQRPRAEGELSPRRHRHRDGEDREHEEVRLRGRQPGQRLHRAPRALLRDGRQPNAVVGCRVRTARSRDRASWAASSCASGPSTAWGSCDGSATR